MSEPYSTKENIHPVSVVIPTLGGESLQGTIERLNVGTLVPNEILVCIPEEDAFKVENLLFPNVKIIRTNLRGQVAQRAIGFQLAENQLVMQLDDDILVRGTCLERMVELILKDTNLAIAPKFYNSVTGIYHSFLVPSHRKQSIFEKILFYVINGRRGYQPGQISKAGINMGIPEKPENWQDVEWLPGGCVLHWSRNLILFNYYHFEGKAYVEDLFHSNLMRKSGVVLTRCGYAGCDVDFSSSSFTNLMSFLKNYAEYAKHMKVFVNEIHRSKFRLYCFLILNIARLAARRYVKDNGKSDE
ncbi:MAG: glycosyltransferase [Bacteroidia bacterium]|nr:glycosyltransferase [Bacteroidia bacterium]